MQDLSWMGLFKKGYKLQYFGKASKKWIDINFAAEISAAIFYKLRLRYKHSIQS